MKQFLIALFICICALPAFAQTKLGIAAIVNDEVITSTDVEGRFNMAIKGANIDPSAAEEKTLRKQALDALIDEKIRIQEANRLGVVASKEEVEDAFKKVAGGNNIPPEEFRSALKDVPGLYESLLHQIKAQISWGNVIKKKIRPQINITESDISAYLEEKQKNPAKVEYNVAEIFLKNTPNNEKLAKQLVSEMRNGKQPFPAVARQFSEGLEASKSGLLGWIPENALDPALNDALKTAKQGAITDPITTPRGLHVLLLREKRDVMNAEDSAKRIHMKQIIIPLPMNVPDEINEKGLAQARFFQGEAKDCKTMDEVLKKINSPMSRDMGQVKLSELPSPVVAIVKDLPVGKISPPLRTNDSIGLFMVCGREENAENAVRDDIANTIGTERLGRLQHRYYRDLRAAAYVDLK